MTNKKSTKKALLTSALSLLLCLSMLVGTTFAWFTDSVSTTNNIITAGNLDVNLYWSVDGSNWNAVNSNTNIFKTGTLWEPGHTEVVYFKVANEGTLALKYNLDINVVSEVKGTNVADEYFQLSDYILYNVTEGVTTYTDSAAARGDESGKKLNVATNQASKILPQGDDHVFTMVVFMPTTVGNEANYKTGTTAPSINLGVNLFATQLTHEEDSFGPTYDEDAPYTSVATADEFKAAIANGGNIQLENDIALSEILVVAKSGTIIDGNGKTLTSTAGRAINVSGANGVIIKNLNVQTTGERGINIIQNATNVTIENVTATASNYTVNVAASATNAVVTIKNSNLTGLNAVNIAGAGSNVSIDNTTINTTDNASVEGYSSICLNKDAVNGRIVATNTTINLTGSHAEDSSLARNGANGGYVSLNGSTENVRIDVVYLARGDYYYGFTTLEGAIAKAEPGEIIYLLRDITNDWTIVQENGINIIIDGNGHKFDGTIAINGKSNGTGTETLTIKNINFVNSTDNAASIDAYIDPNNETRYAHNVTIENCTFTMTGAAKHVAPAVDLYQPYNFTMKNCTVTGAHSALQNKGGHNGITIENVTAIDCKNGIGLGTMDGAITITGCKLNVIGYGIRIDASVASAGITITDCEITANIPVVLRKATGSCVVTFNGTNVMNATNGEGLWLAAGTQEYGDVDKAGLTAANGAIEVVLNDTGLKAEGVYIAK